MKSLHIKDYLNLSLYPSEISLKTEHGFESVVNYDRVSKPNPFTLSKLHGIKPNLKIACYFGDGPADVGVTQNYSSITDSEPIETVIFRHKSGEEGNEKAFRHPR